MEKEIGKESESHKEKERGNTREEKGVKEKGDKKTKRWVDLKNQNKDSKIYKKLRPKSFDEFPGQKEVKNKLKIFLKAAQKRGSSLDHILLSGPPGLGKTTLASIVAQHLNVDFKGTSGPALCRKGDLAAILTSLKEGSILFIDEIHRLSRDVEEYLYSAMEDFHIDMVIGEGLGARSMRFQLSSFTLIGATTRTGLLQAPFRDRFGIIERLSFYSKEDLKQILMRSSSLLNVSIDSSGAHEIADRSRGTPRVANRLLKRVRDYVEVKDSQLITQKEASEALDQLEVDSQGLDSMDRQILFLIQEKFSGGPVGIETLSAALNELPETLEEVYEPYLIREGFIQKTPRGRITTKRALEHLKSLKTFNF